MDEQSHIEAMRAAVRGDRERARARREGGTADGMPPGRPAESVPHPPEQASRTPPKLRRRLSTFVWR